MLQGVQTKSHDGLKTKFFQFFVKTEIIDIKFGKLYAKLIDWRQESDYAEFIEFKEEDLAPLMTQVEEFNDVLVSVRQ